MNTNKKKKSNTKYKDIWRMPSILDDPGKIIIMAGDFPTTNKNKKIYETNTHT